MVDKKIIVVGGLISLFLFSAMVPISIGFEPNKISVSKEQSSNLIKNLFVGGSGSNNYTRIQDAIDDSVDGDTVFVYDDSSPYYENVDVDKSINLIGKNKDTTIIDGGGIGDVVNVSKDWVNITGFTIQNSGSHDIGIRTNSNFNCFSYNNIFNNLHGFYLSSSIGNTIIGNSVSNNNNGIFLWGGNNNTIIGNNVTLNGKSGILLQESHSNMIIGNNVSYTDDVGIALGLISTNNMVIGNNASNNNDGIYLQYYCNNNTLIGNNADSNDQMGIYLDASSSNMLMGNNASNNGGGIGLSRSNNNLLYHNNLINSLTTNVFDFDQGINMWYNSTLQEGNYYDDYTGLDDNGDGIGDTLYPIPYGDNVDRYPLMVPWGENNAPSKPIINGPLYVKPGIDYVYTFNASDINKDAINYIIYWGDGTNTGWVGPYVSGLEITQSHNWSDKGSYTIRAKTKDPYNAESDWQFFQVEVPRTRALYNFNWLSFLNHFPIIKELLYG